MESPQDGAPSILKVSSVPRFQPHILLELINEYGEQRNTHKGVSMYVDMHVCRSVLVLQTLCE